MTTNFWILDRIASHGEHTAIVFQDNEYSYRCLSETIESYYQQIAPQIKRGEIVSFVSDYSLYSIALFFALYKNRNFVVPITTKVVAQIDERIKAANSTKAIDIAQDGELIIHQILPQSEPHSLIVQLQDQDKAGLILFSSGTTGQPKAMVHNLDNLIDSYKEKKSKKLTFLIFLMFDHIGGLNTMLNCIAMGVTMVFPADRNPENVCRTIEKYKVNILPASPTFLNLILISDAHHKYDMTSLRMITYGTEPMPESLLEKLKNSFDRVKFLQTFGTSETGISGASSKSSSSTFLKLDDPNTEYKIVQDELWIRSKTQILGYLNFSMERFTEDGWFRTGDLVEQADDGYIKIVGRNKEMINVGGEKVLPAEVESVLFQIPQVKDCTVFGESNPITGQMVVAKILFDGDEKTSQVKKIVTEFCADKLDRYKIPVKIVLISDSEFSDRFKKKRL